MVLRPSSVLVLFVAFFVLIAPILGRSEPQKPTTKAPAQEPATSTQIAEPNPRGSQDSPLFVRTISPPKTEAEIAQIEEEKNEKLSLDRRMVWFTGGLVFVAVLQLVVLGIQSRILHQQSQYNRMSERNQRIIERAYVKMSQWPPGLNFNESGQSYFVRFRIENCGHTPARITTRCINVQYLNNDQSLPLQPDYSAGVIDTVEAFLLPSEHVGNTLSALFSGEQVKQLVRAGKSRMVIFGYVDYIDQFGQRHRAGYGREYSVILDERDRYTTEDFLRRSNLAFIQEPNYNYDRERQLGEGDDWG